MKKGKAYPLIFLLLLVVSVNIIFSQSEDKTKVKMIGTIGVYIFDPYVVVDQTSEKYVISNLQDYLYINKIKSYYLGKATFLGASSLGKGKGVKYILQVRAFLNSKSKETNGYGASFDSELKLFKINEEKELLSSRASGESSGSLSEMIASAYALSNASINAAKMILPDLIKILKEEKNQ